MTNHEIDLVAALIYEGHYSDVLKEGRSEVDAFTRAVSAERIARLAMLKIVWEQNQKGTKP